MRNIILEKEHAKRPEYIEDEMFKPTINRIMEHSSTRSHLRPEEQCTHTHSKRHLAGVCCFRVWVCGVCVRCAKQSISGRFGGVLYIVEFSVNAKHALALMTDKWCMRVACTRQGYMLSVCVCAFVDVNSVGFMGDSLLKVGFAVFGKRFSYNIHRNGKCYASTCMKIASTRTLCV